MDLRTRDTRQLCAELDAEGAAPGLLRRVFYGCQIGAAFWTVFLLLPRATCLCSGAAAKNLGRISLSIIRSHIRFIRANIRLLNIRAFGPFFPNFWS